MASLNGEHDSYPLKFFVFDYYVLYMFLGIWVGLQVPECFREDDACFSMGERAI